MVRLKRVYEEPGRQDWMRVFVDRLWPRSVKGESGAHLSAAQGPVPLRSGNSRCRYRNVKAKYLLFGELS
jgi:hypothetical protein